MSLSQIIAGLPSRSPDERKLMRANAERILAGTTEKPKESANELLNALNAFEREENARATARAETMPKAQLVVEAFGTMSETDRKIVQVLLDNPGLTSQGLSAKLGWGGMAWHMHFGTMCAKRISSLWPAPYAEERDAFFWCGILADITDVTNLFTMKPEAAEGFAALGFRTKGNAGS
jgi:hypothetical protein